MKIKHSTRYIVTTVILMLLTAPVVAGPFQQGKKKFSLVLSSGAAFGQNYTVLGVGIDYMVLDGVQLGIDAQLWSGADPKIYKISPQASYVFDWEGIKPYGGMFYRLTAIEDQENLGSAGGRVGVYLDQGNGYYLAAGYVYERYLGCDVNLYNDCEDSYPELVLSFSL